MPQPRRGLGRRKSDTPAPSASCLQLRRMSEVLQFYIRISKNICSIYGQVTSVPSLILLETAASDHLSTSLSRLAIGNN